MGRYSLAALFAVAAIASPIEERGLNCNAVDAIVTIMHAQNVATPFCSSLLSIPTITKTSTVTSTPACVTTTSNVRSTNTITTVSTSVVSGVTTIYPPVAVSTTSTCALGATVIPSSANGPSKRNAQPTSCTDKTVVPIGTPTCLTQWGGSSLTSACSCLSIPTPTSVSVSTTTLATKTVTNVIAETPASVTVTSVVTSTSWTSTYSAYQTYTSTYTVLPPAASTTSYPDGSMFGIYDDLDFPGMDILNFFCYPNGPAPPSPFPSCQSFSDCIAECVYYNDNKLGASTSTICGTVTYNAPADGSSGSCYLKTGQVGCGSANSMTNSSVILPLIPNDVQ